jgi:predicted component of type VI protein secretion system
MNVSLVTIGKGGARKDFPVSGPALVIGRKVDADLRIPKPDVSRAHCEIMVNGNKVSLRDLGSSNGTFVNDRKVAQATLKAGDRVKVGPVVFVIQIDGVPEKIVPQMLTPAPMAPPAPAGAAASRGAPGAPKPEAPESAGDDTDEFDIDELGELDVDDLSDLDLDELKDDVEDVEELEELDEADLIPDEDTPKQGRK